jgi:hypothetical protein
VGSFGTFFLRFLLAHLDELEVPLEFESDEDADSILGFELTCDLDGICLRSEERFVVAPPARVLVPRPASSEQSSLEELVDVGAVVAIGFDVVGAEVALKDIVGHVAIVCCFVNRSCFPWCNNDSLD